MKPLPRPKHLGSKNGFRQFLEQGAKLILKIQKSPLGGGPPL